MEVIVPMNAMFLFSPAQAASPAALQDGYGLLEWGIVAMAASALLALGLYTLKTMRQLRRLQKALDESDSIHLKINESLAETAIAKSKMEKALKEEKHSAHAKGNFLATTSNELFALLNKIAKDAEELQKPASTQEQTESRIREINDSARLLKILFNDILNLSYLDADECLPEATEEPCFIPKFFIELKSVLQKDYDEKKLYLKTECPEQFPFLLLCRFRLNQILLRLLEYALRFTDRGGVTLSAEVTAWTDETHASLQIKVSDTGNGIPEDKMEHLFEPFHKGNGALEKSHVAVSIGLLSTKRLVESMGGTFEMRAPAGAGTTAIVSLPSLRVLKQKSGQDGASAPHPHIIRSVVLVDDIMMNLKILSMFCKTMGIEDIHTFTSATDAIAFLETGRTDVVLTDMWMPDMTGEELARVLKKKQLNIPVVAVTADQNIGDSFDLSVLQAILPKPVTSAKLQELFASLANSDQKK
jgi:signal transduction histidine kinase